MSSIVLKFPFICLYSIIAFAFASPIPLKDNNYSKVAVLILTNLESAVAVSSL